MIRPVNDSDSRAASLAPVTAAVPVDDDGWCLIDGSYAIPRGSEHRLGLLLVRLGSVLAEMADGHLAAAGLNGRDYSILAVLSDDDPGTQNEIAALVGKAPGVIVSAIDGLERDGLVQRTRDVDDRRRSRVTLTAKGRRCLARADTLADETVAEMLPGLAAAEREQLRALLIRGLGVGGSA